MGVALRRHTVGDLAGDLPCAHDIGRRRASDAQHYVIITNLCFMRKITAAHHLQDEHVGKVTEYFIRSFNFVVYIL